MKWVCLAFFVFVNYSIRMEITERFREQSAVVQHWELLYSMHKFVAVFLRLTA